MARKPGYFRTESEYGQCVQPSRSGVSTANLYSAVQPGGSLFGFSIATREQDVAYGGKAEDYGTVRDPMVGGVIGGVNVFGGGLALYDSDQ